MSLIDDLAAAGFDVQKKVAGYTVSGSTDVIRTIDELVEAAGVDLQEWRIVRPDVGCWSTPIKDADGGVHYAQNYRVKFTLEPIAPEWVHTGIEQAAKNLALPSDTFTNNLPKKRNDQLGEVCLFDHHFGKLAWAGETGEDYDLKTAARRFDKAVNNLLGDMFVQGGAGKILFPIGQDFFHIDNANSTTFSGTPQDVDGRLGKVFRTGLQSVVAAIDTMRQIAPVQVLWVPGNHDATTSYFLCECLAQRYHADKMVDIQINKTREYISWKKVLIGFTHGNEEKPADLPNLMATECADFHAAKIREFHTGHFHSKKETKYIPLQTVNGVTHRVLSSLSGTDAWHFKKGYVGALQAAHGFLWDGSGTKIRTFEECV